MLTFSGIIHTFVQQMRVFKTFKVLLPSIMLLFCQNTVGQGTHPWEQMLASIMTAEDIESSEWEDTYEMLCELEQNPLNLNTATREELEALPFLSAQQVEAIMEYLYYHESMKSMNELRMIQALDYVQIELLRHFCNVKDKQAEPTFPKLDDVMKYGRHELMANVRVPFYQRQGDRNGYLGYPYRHWLRYQFSYHDYIKLGGVGSQDAGEPFFANRNMAGYDFYSYYLQLKHLGRVENLIVGKYKLSMGMGLVVNNSFGMGKLAMLQQLGRSTNTVRPHASRSQSGFFQGAAATFRLSPQWMLTTFASYRPIDATLNNDSTMRTILTDGYHRTPTEMEKKNNSHATDAGAHVAYRWNGLHAGATALYTHFDRQLQPQISTLYRRYYAQGNNFLNLSADYGYLHHRFALNGETAINRDGALATINSFSMNVEDGLNVMLLQRFYSFRYTALYARAVTEGSRVQNESAIYLGVTWQPSPHLRLQAYTDYAYFAWARYQVSQSSYAWDNLLTATYKMGYWTASGRYRLHLRQKDNNTKTALVNQQEHRVRLTLSKQDDSSLYSSTQIDAVSTAGEMGYMLSQTAGYQWQLLKLNGMVSYFHTDSYASRLYVYERSPLYSFSFPAYYGEGMRLTLMAQANITSRLSLTAKLGLTHYFDRTTISSGLQQINGSTQTDLDVQMRWRL